MLHLDAGFAEGCKKYGGRGSVLRRCLLSSNNRLAIVFGNALKRAKSDDMNKE
jgi:hypothetical protein